MWAETVCRILDLPMPRVIIRNRRGQQYEQENIECLTVWKNPCWKIGTSLDRFLENFLLMIRNIVQDRASPLDVRHAGFKGNGTKCWIRAKQADEDKLRWLKVDILNVPLFDGDSAAASAPEYPLDHFIMS